MDIERRRSPDSLSHYTSLEGLRGIIQNDELWASNVAFLNDREELLHGVKCVQQVVPRMLKETRFKGWADVIVEVLEEVELGYLPNTYATCFCEKSDILSQWRSYGGAEQGVCVVFDRSGLQALQTGKKSFLVPVEYGAIKAKASIKNALEQRLLSVTRQTSVTHPSRKVIVYDMISELIPQFKHKGFDSELEWRFVVQHKTLRDSVCFRTNKNVLVPYIKLSQGKLPLKYVRVGPGNDQDLTSRSIALLLEACGYDAKVVKSKVPFRS